MYLFPLLLLQIYICKSQFRQNIFQPYRYYNNAILMGHKITAEKEYRLFYRFVTSIGGYSMLFEKKEQFTIFPLENDTILKFLKNKINSFSARKHLIESHLFRGRYDVSKLRQTQSLTSVNGITMYVNSLYDRQKKLLNIWVQGQKIELPPVTTPNGVIYKINSPLQKSRINLIDFLRKSGSHNNFTKILENQKQYFRFPFGTTLLAPFDIAFSHLPLKYRKELYTNDIKQRRFIQSHVLTRPMCKERLFYHVGWSRVKNKLGQSLRIYSHSYNTQSNYINGAAVLTDADVSQGWVFGITKAILPEIRFNVLETLREENCHEFLQKVISTGYMPRLELLLQQHTLFAPTDLAFSQLSEEVKERLSKDKTFLKDVVEYHIHHGKVLSQAFSTKKILISLAKRRASEGQEVLQVNKFINITTVENSLIEKPDTLATNGVVHIISNVLIPPKESLFDILQNRKEFSAFKKLLLTCNSTFLTRLRGADKYFTLLIPVNGALKTFFKSKKRKIQVVKADEVQKSERKHSFINAINRVVKRKRNNIASRHIFEDVFIPGDVIIKTKVNVSMNLRKINGRQTRVFIAGDTLKMRRYPPVLLLDTIVARDGIIIVIDRVISKRRNTKTAKSLNPDDDVSRMIKWAQKNNKT